MKHFLDQHMRLEGEVVLLKKENSPDQPVDIRITKGEEVTIYILRRWHC